MLICSVQWAMAATTEAPSQPNLAQAQGLLAEGKAEEAFNLLLPFEDTWAGHLQYDYLLARSALESGRPSLASFIYERILAVEPNYVGVRLENGRAYLELGNYARAKQEIETVLRFDNLPPDLRQTAEQYARVAEQGLEGQRTFFNGFAEYGFGYDDNINAAIAQRLVPLPSGIFLLLDDLSTAQEDFYHALNAGGEVIHALGERWSVFGAVDYRGRFYVDKTFFNYSDVEGRLGVGRASGPHNVRLSARYGRFILDDTSLRDVRGGTLDWLYAVDSNNQLDFTASYGQFRFLDDLLKSNDFDGVGLGIGWNRGFADGRALAGITVSGGYENATQDRIDGNKWLWGVNVTGQATLAQQLGFFAFFSIQQGYYDQVNALFLTERNDTFYTISSGVTWNFAKGFSLRPQVNWSKNDSNVALNEFERTDLSLNLRWDF
jgi:tetratricopeptide (TPR) repeat protein